MRAQNGRRVRVHFDARSNQPLEPPKEHSPLVAKRSRGLESCGFDGAGRERFELPLSRSDIADYLGLTLETVSRQLRVLKSDGIIRFDGTRNVTILDPARLSEAATTPFI